MEKIYLYAKGITIGIITEYCIRIDIGYIQGVILGFLTIGMIIDIINEFKR